MNTDRIAQRFAERPGFTLVSYGDVGLPFFRIRLRAILLERKATGPFPEFVMRAVASGVSQLAEIGRLLGLDRLVLDQTVANLLGSSDLVVLAQHGGTRGLELTDKGRRTLTEAEAVQPSEQEIEIDFDGLLRKPYLFMDGLLTPRQLRDQQAREIPPSPSRPPEVSEIEIGALQRIVREFAERRQARADLLGVARIEQRTSYFLPAVLLVYQAIHGPDVQVGFAVNGRPSPDHEAAFAKARLRKRFALGAEGGPRAEDVASQLLGESLVQGSDRSRILKLHHEIAEASPVAAEDPEPDVETAARAAEAERELATIVVRPLETFEHPKFLRDALANAKKRLMILSPWLRGAVVNATFIQQLEGLLDRGVEVYLGWGISKLESERDADPAVHMDLDALAARHATFHFRRLGDTHAKVLLCDDRFVIVGSFNWLSFRGDPSRTFRDERSMLVTMPDVIEQQFRALVSRFEGPPKAQSPRVFEPD